MTLTVTPSIASSQGNCTLRIVGRDTERVIAIMFGTTYFASFRRINKHTITLILPFTTPGTHTLDLVLRKKHGVACTRQITFVTASGINLTRVEPTLDRYANPSLPLNHYRRRKITLRGNGLSAATGVWQDGVSIKFRVVDDQTIVALQRFQQGCATSSASSTAPSASPQEIAPRDAVDATYSDSAEKHCGEARSLYPGEPGYNSAPPCPPDAFIHASDITVTSATASSNVFQLLAVQSAKPKRHAATGVLATTPVLIDPKRRCTKKQHSHTLTHNHHHKRSHYHSNHSHNHNHNHNHNHKRSHTL